MHCHLLIPSLFPPQTHTPGNDPLAGIKVPALQTLLARGRQHRVPYTEMECWLCELFGVSRQQDYPVASLCLLAEGVNPESGYWLRADPAHMAVERDQVVLTEASAFPITRDEADALVKALNQHFAADGMYFVATRQQHWYLRLEQTPLLTTHSLYQAAGRNIHPLLPAGQQAMRWRALLNEVQMLLFNHPVNEARESRGIAPVNSIWAWGGGTLPTELRLPFDHVWADDPLARGLALAAGAASHPLPEQADAWLEQRKTGGHLLVLDKLRAAACYGDPHTWRSQLQLLEQLWFAPLKRAVQRGAIDLSLHAPTPAGTLSFTLTRSSLWKLWRPARPLIRYRPQEI